MLQETFTAAFITHVRAALVESTVQWRRQQCRHDNHDCGSL